MQERNNRVYLYSTGAKGLLNLDLKIYAYWEREITNFEPRLLRISAIANLNLEGYIFQNDWCNKVLLLP